MTADGQRAAPRVLLLAVGATFFLACMTALLFSVRGGWGYAVAALLAAGAVAAAGGLLLLRLTRRLDESARWLGAIVAAVPDAIITVDACGVIRSLNPAAGAMFGYRGSELAGRRFAGLLPVMAGDSEDDGGAAAFAARLARHGLGGDRRTVTVQGLRRNGAVFHMEVSVSALEITGGTVYVFVCRDVGERVHTQQALRRAHAKLEERVARRTRELVSANTRLREEINERQQIQEQREQLIGELREALSQIKTLRGLLPICASCKRIRDDGGYWKQIEVYIRDHSEAEFSHAICPECMKKLYPEINGPA